MTNDSSRPFPPGVAGEVHGSGPVLVWGHGLTSSRATEDATELYAITDLPGFRVVRYDAPGHGASAPVTDDETTTWPRLGQLMLDVARSQGAERFVAAGASMGCATALWAAVTDPDAIAALVLVIAPTAWETRAEQREFYLRGAEVVANEGMRAYLDLAETRPLNPTLEERAVAQRAVGRAALEQADPTSFAHVLRGAARSNLPAREQLRALAMPALILSWENDPQHPVSTGEQLAELLTNSSFHRAGRLREVLGWRDIAATWLASLDL